MRGDRLADVRVLRRREVLEADLPERLPPVRHPLDQVQSGLQLARELALAWLRGQGEA